MTDKAKTKAEFIKAWKSHNEDFYRLVIQAPAGSELREQMKQTIKRMELLIEEVADLVYDKR